MSVNRARRTIGTFHSAVIAAVSWGVLATELVAQRPATQTPHTGIIIGRVVEFDTSEPVAGVRVTRWLGTGGDLTQYEVISDAQGRFLFRNVGPGSWRILAEMPGYAPGTYGRRRPNGPDRLLRIEPGGHATDLTIPLFKTSGVITGRVTDEHGEPVVGVTVQALRARESGEPGAFELVTLPVTVTDDRGRYRLVLSTGQYAVVVQTRIVAITNATGSAAQARSTAALDHNGARIPMPSGLGVLAAGMLLHFGDALRPGPPVALTEKDGRMWVYASAVSAEPAGGRATLIHVEPRSHHDGVDLRLRLVAAHRVTGRLTGPDGPAAGVTLRLVPATLARVAVGAAAAVTTITGADGTFAMPGVPTGDYVLLALEGPARVPVRSSVAPALGSSGDDPPAAGLSATVALSSGPAPFLWTQLPVSVGNRDLDGLQVEIRRGASISGRIEFDAAGPQPSPEMIQKIAVIPRRADSGPRLLNVSHPNGDGSFVTAEHPPGAFFLTANNISGWALKAVTHRGRSLLVEPVDVPDEGLTDVVLTYTNKVATVDGVVRTARGAVDPDAAVILFPVAYGSATGAGIDLERVNVQRFQLLRVDEHGRFSIRTLPAGEYWIVAIDDSLATAWRTPGMIQKLTRVAARIVFAEHGRHTVNLTTQAIK